MRGGREDDKIKLNTETKCRTAVQQRREMGGGAYGDKNR